MMRHQDNCFRVAQGSDVRKGGLSSLQAPRAAEEPQSPTMKDASPRRLTAKTSNSMFSCSAAKQYERLDHLASARKSVIEADIVAHLQQATLGHAASLQFPVGPSCLLAYTASFATANSSLLQELLQELFARSK